MLRLRVFGGVLIMPPIITFFLESQEVIILHDAILVGIYLLRVNNRNIRTRCEIFSNLTIKTPEQSHWCGSGVFIVNFEHILHLVPVFLLLTLSMQLLAGIFTGFQSSASLSIHYS